MIRRLNKGAKQENHKDEIRLITPPCNNGGGVIDVEVLPNKWKGTPVPNSGYVEKVYFNTNLSIKEMNAMLDKLEFYDDGTYYDITYGANDSHNIYIERAGSSYKIIDISSTIFDKDTWQDSFSNPNILNVYVVPELHGNPSGKQNHLISSLVSITPFEKVEINTSSIYRLPDGSLWVYYNNEWKELGGSEGNSDLIDFQDMSYNIYNDASFTEDFEIGKIYRQREKVSDTYVFRYIKDGDEEYINFVTDPEYSDWGLSYVFETLDVNNITEETKFTDCITGNIYSINNILDYPIIIKSENRVVFIFGGGEGSNPYYLEDFIEHADNYDEEDPYNLAKGYKVVNSLDEAKEGGYLYIKYGDILPDYNNDNLFVPGTKEYYNGVFLQKPNGEYINIKYSSNLPNIEVVSGDRDVTEYPESDEFGFGRVIVKYGTKSNRTNFSSYATGWSNSEIRLIDTSNATNMTAMFMNCKNITTIPLIDTRKVTNMKSMFENCTNLTEIPPLTTSNVTSMNDMFYKCTSLTSIPKLDTSNVTNMGRMFYDCNSLTSIPEIDTSNVTAAYNMFCKCTNLVSVPELDLSKANNLNFMFQNCTNLTTVSLLNTSNVITMDNIFEECKNLISVLNLDTRSVTSASRMFYGCSNLETVPELYTSNVTNMSSMFSGCSNLTSVPELDTSSATDTSFMFNGCSNLETIPELDTNNVTNMNCMFQSCSSLTSIPKLGTSNVTNMSYMFNLCANLETIPELDTSNVTNMTSIFQNCTNLKSILTTGMKVDFSISYSTRFEREDLLTILNNLATVTTTQTLKMGSTNLAKLTDEDKLIATNKGWTLA